MPRPAEFSLSAPETQDQDGKRQNPLAALRRFVAPRPTHEACELCNAPVAEVHQHLIDPEKREIVCCCDACAILFSGQQAGKFRRVPRRIERLVDFRLSDIQWERLYVPINLAFFFVSSPLGRTTVFYPSPAGATESLLTLESWAELVKENPILQKLESDVEALLVNRVDTARDYFVVPIDECYRLVGLIRSHWRGLSGGAKVWEEIDRYFSSLRDRSHVSGPQS